MSRLTMQEVIEHCETTAKDIEKTHERYRKWLELEPMPISVKRYYEHKQTAEWLKELQHYKDLEEQGRLIELPCKVGDTVYVIGTFTGQLTEDKVHTFEVSPAGIVLFLDCGYVVFIEQQLGKTVFLTKEEAEEALKRLQGNE